MNTCYTLEFCWIFQYPCNHIFICLWRHIHNENRPEQKIIHKKTNIYWTQQLSIQYQSLEIHNKSPNHQTIDISRKVNQLITSPSSGGVSTSPVLYISYTLYIFSVYRGILYIVYSIIYVQYIERTIYRTPRYIYIYTIYAFFSPRGLTSPLISVLTRCIFALCSVGCCTHSSPHTLYLVYYMSRLHWVASNIRIVHTVSSTRVYIIHSSCYYYNVQQAVRIYEWSIEQWAMF